MNRRLYPMSQRELLLFARGSATQTAFAQVLGVDRSCLSRYESEALGAPTSVINQCLQIVALTQGSSGKPGQPLNEFDGALLRARQLVEELERLRDLPRLRRGNRRNQAHARSD